MLLHLQNITEENINKLLAFAKAHNMQLALVGDNENNVALPGKALTEVELTNLIEEGPKSGMISMEAAHDLIRNGMGCK
jgi:hypothetical protein